MSGKLKNCYNKVRENKIQYAITEMLFPSMRYKRGKSLWWPITLTATWKLRFLCCNQFTTWSSKCVFPSFWVLWTPSRLPDASQKEPLCLGCFDPVQNVGSIPHCLEIFETTNFCTFLPAYSCGHKFWPLSYKILKISFNVIAPLKLHKHIYEI